MGELSGLLTVYELAFLLFRVKEAAQVEDNGQKEHEAGHGEDGHRLLTGDGTVEAFTPEPAGHVHLKGESREEVRFHLAAAEGPFSSSGLGTGVPAQQAATLKRSFVSVSESNVQTTAGHKMLHHLKMNHWRCWKKKDFHHNGSLKKKSGMERTKYSSCLESLLGLDYCCCTKRNQT